MFVQRTKIGLKHVTSVFKVTVYPCEEMFISKWHEFVVKLYHFMRPVVDYSDSK